MRPRILFPALAICMLISFGAYAEEVIHFTNGTTMAAVSHEVRGEMIHVDLGDNAKIAFPMSMVEKITRAGKEVMLMPSFKGKNLAVSGRGGGSGSGSGGGGTVAASVPSRIPQRGHTPNRTLRGGGSIGGNAAGNALSQLLAAQAEDGSTTPGVRRPMAGSVNRKVRNMTVAGDMSIFGETARNGRTPGTTTTVSGRTVIQPPSGPRGAKPGVTGIKQDQDAIWAQIKAEQAKNAAKASGAGADSGSGSGGK